MATVFSGIQPTGKLTIGNYLGAITKWVKMQDEYSNCIYCIVDLHAITVPQDPKALREACSNNLAMYIACGISPEKSIIFTQSAVGHHAELGWILGCSTPLGWLNRMTQFKDKAGKDKEKACLGLYAYPTLMAADILLYNTTHVPVGDDQTQHLELARDIAGAFNRQYNVDYFKEPLAVYSGVATRVMSLRDGTKKMSKSDESDYSRINLTDDADLIVQKIKKSKTDAIVGITYEPESRPDIANLINIYSAFTGEKVEVVAAKLQNYTNAQLKDELAQVIIQGLAPIQKEYQVIISDKAQVHKLAQEGAAKANAIAEKRMNEIKEIVGLSC
jgi:tryptophanyl-tRNA synthetase